MLTSIACSDTAVCAYTIVDAQLTQQDHQTAAEGLSDATQVCSLATPRTSAELTLVTTAMNDFADQDSLSFFLFLGGTRAKPSAGGGTGETGPEW